MSKHKQTGTAVAIPIEVVGHTRQVEGYGEDRERVIGAHGISPTLRSTDYKEPYKIAIPVSTPEITLKTQNGRRFKENGDESFTLTARDRHGVALGLAIESSKDHPGMYVELEDGSVVYAVWYEKYACYIAIRKLTPRECFKLQGWDDEYFDRAEFVNSDSQLYKQAGNGVTVNVVYEIAKRIAEIKEV